jgi:hypothetical protein
MKSHCKLLFFYLHLLQETRSEIESTSSSDDDVMSDMKSLFQRSEALSIHAIHSELAAFVQINQHLHMMENIHTHQPVPQAEIVSRHYSLPFYRP